MLDMATDGTAEAPAGASSTGAAAAAAAAAAAGAGKHAAGKIVAVRVHMLDDTVTLFQIQAKALGAVLFEQVCKQLNLLESDYFGLEYVVTASDRPGSAAQRFWLDMEKPLNRQLGLALADAPPVLRFGVKFYTPDPAQLEEEFTRYLFSMQIKADLALGSLQCNDKTAALLASYLVQAECGDYVAEDYPDHTYLASYKFVPTQDAELERRIMENHKKHVGQSPAEADLNLLETARRCELYGIKVHPAKDPEGVPLNLAVASVGVLVFQNLAKINTFSWAKVRKLSFKRKKFLIKLHPEAQGNYKETVEFHFDGRDECKNFWKKCVEHHGFFRCTAARPGPRAKARVLSRGSSFRYTGRTQKQIIDFVRENYVKRQSFQRSQSFRHSSPLHSSAGGGVGTSLSVHPLLPVGENASANRSVSCGSVVVVAGGPDSAAAAAAAAAGRASQTPDRTERVDVHQYRHAAASAPPPPLPPPPADVGADDNDVDDDDDGGGGGDDGRGGQSPLPPSSTPLHQVVYYQQQQQQQQQQQHQSLAGGFNSLPRAHSGAMAPPAHLASSTSSSSSRPVAESEVATREESEPPPPAADEAPPAAEPQPPAPAPPIASPASPPLSPLLGVELSPPPPEPNNNNNINNNVANSCGLQPVVKSNGPTADADIRRKRYPTDKAYYIAKELLMTERTYKKDLEVVDLWFRDELSKEDCMPEEVLLLLFNHVDPIYEQHSLVLKELEHRLAAWEGRANNGLNAKTVDPAVHRLGDLLLKITAKLELYQRYVEKHRLILEKLEQAFKRNKKFEQVYRDFETQKVCYLPLNTFLVRPLQRILHYQLIADRLVKLYEPGHSDAGDCAVARSQLEPAVAAIGHHLHATENFVKLVELQRDLVGTDTVVQPHRQFLREGCLQKLSRKGFQQRMFFLFSDVLLYTNRTSGPQLQFKVHGQLPLRGVMVEDSEPKMGNEFCFTIYGGNRALLVAATSQEEKDKWLEDILQAVQGAKVAVEDAARFNYYSLKSCSSSEEVLDKTGLGDDSTASPSVGGVGVGKEVQRPQQQQRSNTTVHVCWHRNTSISCRDHLLALENQLSGYLLRKFKNSNGWQKLWVVFTNFCLFFYKTFQDDFPLASLPLLGYSVTSPSERDHIHKDYVFKLQFKNHVYFFRAESEYTFGRWMEVLGSATQHSGRLRLFSRKDSESATPRY